MLLPFFFFFFFFNDTATTEIYTLSLHDALPICRIVPQVMSLLSQEFQFAVQKQLRDFELAVVAQTDRKSTRLNSSHSQISYAVFCLKKKKQRDRRFAVLPKGHSPLRRTLPYSFF